MQPTSRPFTRALARGLAASTVAVATLAGLTASPASVTSWSFTETATPQVSGTYTPVVGNFSDAEYYDDLLWYAPGAGAEYLWTDVGNKQFTPSSLGNAVNGTYTPIVGDFSGDQLDDILWYAPGPGADVLWTMAGKATHTSTTVSISGTYQPVVLDDTSGKDDIVWTVPGGGSGSVWSFTGTGAQHASHAVQTPAGTIPLAGDFDGDAAGDVFWYGTGATPDALWYFDGSGTYTTKAVNVSGTYTPVVNRLTFPSKIDPFDSRDDIFWYRAGQPTALWEGQSNRTFTTSLTPTFTSGTPIPVSNRGMFIWSATGPDQYWATGYGTAISVVNTQLGTGYTPINGNWWGGGHDIVWYKPGSSPEVLFT